MEKILITGTGRCGTTFLIKLFTFLGYDTGYTKDNYEDSIFKNCNSGMELEYNDIHYVLKNPRFIENIETIVNDKEINIKNVIIPIRNYTESAKSRFNNGDQNTGGGLWNANTEDEQLLFYNKIMSNYLYFMVTRDINTIFLDFEKMVNNKKYLFNKLKSILEEKNICFCIFSDLYDIVSSTSKPKNNNKEETENNIVLQNNNNKEIE